MDKEGKMRKLAFIFNFWRFCNRGGGADTYQHGHGIKPDQVITF